MKKSLCFLIIIAILSILFSCDYDEKSIQALSDLDFPKQATTDFILPKGVYAPITYTSSNENVLKIYDGHYVNIFQQETDVTVTIEARVNNRYATYETTVLKKGSRMTPRERLLIVFEEFSLPEKINNQIELLEEYQGFKIKYEHYYSETKYDIIRKSDEKLYLVPRLIQNTKASIRAIFDISEFTELEKSDIVNNVYHHTFQIDINNKDTVNYQIFQQINLDFANDNSFGYVTTNFKLPIKLNDKADYQIKWSLDSNYFASIKDGVFTIKESLTKGHYELNLYLDITYNDLVQRFTYHLTIVIE